MNYAKFSSHLPLILDLTLFILAKAIIAQNIISSTESSHLIPKCTDFTDTRSSHHDQSVHNSARQLVQKGHSNTMKCDMDKTEQVAFSGNLDTNIPAVNCRNYRTVTNGSSDRHQHPYFTLSGHFYDNRTGNYYNPDGDYCLQSISNEGVDLRVCSFKSDCSSTSTPNTFCLPKCCALDETLLFWKKQCARLPETQGRTPWEPVFYQGSRIPHTRVESNPNIIYQMAQLPQKCFSMKYNQTSATRMVYDMLSSAYVKHPIDNSSTQEQHQVKLTFPENKGNGKVQFMTFFNPSRKWKVANYDNFCVEGFYIKSRDAPRYTGNPENFVIFYCPNDDEDDPQSKDVKNQKWKSWTYAAVSLLVLMFLLATLLVYLMLWDKHNLHGLTVLSYTGSTFGSYLFLTIAHFISLFPNPEMTGINNRGFFCFANAVLAHYFYLSSYLWLAVMNFDLWTNLKSMHVVDAQAKEWTKFRAYGTVAWVIPAALITSFVVVDEVYRDPLTEVPVPDYGMETCFVSPDFRGEYVYAPMAILLGFNIVFIGLTMWIFVKARRKNKSAFGSGGAANANSYNAKLFGKLFVLMGGACVFDFLTWYYNNTGNKPWPIVVFEVISYFTPVALFVLFCLNDKIITQLKEKFPRLMGLQVGKKKGDIGANQSHFASNRTSMCSLEAIGRTIDDIPLENIGNEKHTVIV